MPAALKKRARTPWTWVPTLYFAEGLPYVAVMAVSVIFYKQMGLSNAQVTLYTSWLYLPWVVKPLWSPFVDVVKTKRAWILAMELLLGAAFGGVAFTIPTTFWLQGTLFFFWVMAFSSATHDIAADGFYMLGLTSHEQAWFVGIRSTFYRLATIFGQGLLVMAAGNLQVLRRNSIPMSWMLVFYGVAGIFIFLWLWHAALLPRPTSDCQRKGLNINTIWLELWRSVKTFFGKEQMLAGILFMLLYRMPEGLLSKVSALFLIDARHNGGLGLSPQEYGFVQGTVGILGLTIGGILGGILAGRHGLKRWLWPMAAAITLPDVVYVCLAFAPATPLSVISTCVFIEQFGYGFGFAAYMLYLIFYSRGSYKTSHYALCTALMALSMMLPGLFAGTLQEAVGYRAFFLIVVALCIVTFVVTAFVKIDPDFGRKTPAAE
ncbi:MAG: MFS transporter [Prevotella sp.]|nr:MFS transporter [Prevotella sp.]